VVGVVEFASLASSIREQIARIVAMHDRARVAELAKTLGELARFNPRPVIVAGSNVCIASLLDHTMIGYSDIRTLIPPFHAILVTGWQAERLLEEIGWSGDVKGVYFMPTCLIKGRCVYHLHDMETDQDLLSLAAYLAFIAVLNDLLIKMYGKMYCTELHGDCIKLAIDNLKALARANQTTMIIKHLDMIEDPQEIYCTPDILVEHRRTH
jgi:hypothetical protein